MRRLAILAVALLLLAGCAHREPKPATCDGKHRRPANPYGSVLPNIPGADAKAPAAAEPPGPQSSVDPQRLDAKSFAPCGAHA